jgi:hypothetical protein
LSQGLERLVKVSSLLADENPSSLVSELHHHRTNIIFDVYLRTHIQLKKEQRGFLDILTTFYVKERYNHLNYGDPESETSAEYPNGGFSIYPNMLRQFVLKYCKPYIEHKSDGLKDHLKCNMGIKKFLHSVIKDIAVKIFKYIRESSVKKNLYIHELRSDSKAFYVFLDKSQNLLKKRIAVYELLLYAMKTKGFIDKAVTVGIKPLEFDIRSVMEIVDTINSKTGLIDVFDVMDSQLEHMEPELRKERLLLHSYIQGV